MKSDDTSSLPGLRGRQAHSLVLSGGPRAKCFDVGRREPGVTMERKIIGKRHIAGRDFAANVVEKSASPGGVRYRPIRKIHVAAAVPDVADHQPGDRRHVAIPRPARRMGMTIAAGAIEDGFGLGAGQVQRMSCATGNRRLWSATSGLLPVRSEAQRMT